MNIRAKERYLNLGFILIFLFISLFIHCFHTEKTLTGKDNCPACNFQNSSLATGYIYFFYIPDLIFKDIIKPNKTSHLREVFISSALSRSPPFV